MDTSAHSASPSRQQLDRSIARIALPAFATLFTEPAYLLADTAIVGTLGTEPLAALAVANTVLVFAFAIFVFLTFNTAAGVATHVGAGSSERAAKVAVAGIWLAIIIGVIATVATLSLGPFLVDLVTPNSTADGVRSGALTYLRISALGFPFLLVTMAASGGLRGHRDTRTPLLAAAVSTVLNLTVESVAVFWFDMGIGASAASTVLAQGVGLAVLLVKLWPRLAAQGAGWRPEVQLIRSQAAAGMDLVVRTILLRGVFAMCVYFAGRAGTIDLAAYQISIGIFGFLVFGLDSLEAAGQVLVAEAIGAKDRLLAKVTTRRVMQLSVYLGVVLALATLAAAPVLPRLFTSDPRVGSVATQSLWWVAGMLPLSGLAFAVDGVAVAAARTRLLMVIMVVCFAAFSVAMVAADRWWGPLQLGFITALLGAFMALRAVLGVQRIRAADWSGDWADTSSTQDAEPLVLG